MTAQWRYIRVAILLLLAGCQAGSGSLNETAIQSSGIPAAGAERLISALDRLTDDPYTLTAIQPAPDPRVVAGQYNFDFGVGVWCVTVALPDMDDYPLHLFGGLTPDGWQFVIGSNTSGSIFRSLGCRR